MSVDQVTNDDLQGDEIAQALLPLRPDPDEFRAGVERRLARAALSRGDCGADARTAHAEGRLRRAAAFLPLELAPGALAATGAKFSASAVWKSLTGLVLLPALSVGMLLAPLVFALESFGAHGEVERNLRRRTLFGWWRVHRLAALASLALLALLAWVDPAGAAALLLCGAALVPLLLVASQRTAGSARRSEMGRMCALFLFTFAMWMAVLDWPWRKLLPPDSSVSWTFAALALAGMLCAWLSFRAEHRSPWSFITRSNGTQAALALQVALILPMLTFALLRAFTGEATREDLTRELAAFDADGSDILAWEYAEGFGALLGDDYVAPESLRAHWRARFEADPQPLPSFLTAGLRLGLIAPDELVAARPDLAPAALFKAEGPLYATSLYDSVALELTLRGPALDADQRARLGARLEASLDTGPAIWRFARAVEIAEALAALDLRDELERMRAPVLALLRDRWVVFRGGALGTDLAGFSSSEEHAEPRFPDAWALPPIQLMERFGVPENVSFSALERTLDHFEHSGLPWKTDTIHQRRAALARIELQRELAPQPRGLRRVFELRVMLAACLLGALCVLATLQAPPDPRRVQPVDL